MPGLDVPFAIGSATWPGVSKLTEEAGEVLQVLGKLIATGGALNHWDGTNLAERLTEELGDLLAAAQFVVANNHDLDGDAIARRMMAKLDLFNEWHATADATDAEQVDQ